MLTVLLLTSYWNYAMARQFQRTHSTNQEDFSLKSARSSIFAYIAKN